jgi:hypothetical protein
MKPNFLLPILLLLCSCGTTLPQKFNMANELARSASHNSMPLFRTWCDGAIDECKAAGIKKEDKRQCKGYVACRTARRTVVKTANAVHIGVKMGLYYLTIKDEKKALAMLSSVMKALGELKHALQQAGFLEPLGLAPVEIKNSDSP